MEIYSDNELKPEVTKHSIIIVFFCLAPFQVGLLMTACSYHSIIICSLTLLFMCIFPVFSFSPLGIELLKKRIESGFIGLFYICMNLSFFIFNFVVIDSKTLIDVNFIMYTSLMASMLLGFFVGAFFSHKTKFFNKKYMIIRGNEIELRKVDMFGALSLNRMPFLKAPLIKMRNALYIVAFFIGTGGAGIGMGIAEMLKRSDVISPEISVHSVLFFCLGMPVLFTFGILIYSMVTYLLEWRKLVARIEREYGEHKIIFNSQKKSYKKIREILDSQSSEQEKVNE